jgi:hypothetical protein
MATYESKRYNTPVPDAAKIADGSVNNTEFEHLDGVTSDIQTQINSKLNTTGGTITGNVTITDNDHLYIGDGQDIDILSDGSTGFIKGNDLRLQSSTGENYITTAINGATKLFYDNVLKAETTGSGLTVSGAMAATTVAGDGSALTALNASNLASGTVPTTRLPASVTSLGLNGGEFFTANGTWTCPAGVTVIFAIITGGGGGAGGQGTRYQTYNYNTRSGKGGHGGHFEGLIAVTPGTTYNIVIGTGGNCGDNYAFTFSPIRSGFAGTNTTAFGITATGGGGGSGSFTGTTGGNPNPSGVTGTDGTASGTAIITFRNLSAFQGAFAMKGLRQPQSPQQSYTIAGISPHVITGPSDIYAAGYGGEEGSNVNIAANDIKSGTGGNGGMVQIFF